MSAQRILVTGGAGFIGSSLCEKLVHQGHSVVALDSMFRGDETNLAAIIGEENFSLYAGDVRDVDDLDACVEAMGGLDIIYHLAAINGTKWFHEAAHSVIDVNINGTLRTLELAMANDARYVFASSPEAFGEPESQPIADGDKMIFSNPAQHQRHSYGGSKYLGEVASQHAAREGLDVRIVRPFNAYGPRLCGDDYGQVIGIFFQNLLDGVDLTVHGNGSQSRSFTWIEDVVDGFVRAGEANIGPNMVFNIGSTEEISILDLAGKIAKFSLNGAEVVYGEGYFGDSTRRLPEISRAVELLNWQSKVSLDDGLQLMWDVLTT
ncbi:MAG: SDR family NAD(P)-dependent oxidoreductase [Euryarchaeota archaeon]|nr:SDR family NAD(P)-dependent oxidoreductase [Euryarchaeota archaeon]